MYYVLFCYDLYSAPFCAVMTPGHKSDESPELCSFASAKGTDFVAWLTTIDNCPSSAELADSRLT